MPTIVPGTHAPDFRLQDQDGRWHSLADHAGRPVVLYFYPKDDTPGCTREACSFRDALPDFSQSAAVVLGVSVLDRESKARFAGKYGLTFPLLADADAAVAREYGVWQQKTKDGRQYMGIARTTFLIDGGGIVVRRWDDVKVDGHAQEVLEAVRSLG
jgi:peroxiredoxin Q/BCP